MAVSVKATDQCNVSYTRQVLSFLVFWILSELFPIWPVRAIAVTKVTSDKFGQVTNHSIYWAMEPILPARRWTISQIVDDRFCHTIHIWSDSTRVILTPHFCMCSTHGISDISLFPLILSPCCVCNSDMNSATAHRGQQQQPQMRWNYPYSWCKSPL